MNNIAIDSPQQLHSGINLKNLKDIVAKLFSVSTTTKKDVASVLVSENTLHQKKTAYKGLLKNIIDTVHSNTTDIEWIQPHFNYAQGGKWIHFNFDDPIIQDSLMKYDFLKSWDELSTQKIQEFILAMHKNGLHYAMAKNSLRKFNEDDRPYLDVDETWILLKKAMELRGGDFMDIPSWAHSFN